MDVTRRGFVGGMLAFGAAAGGRLSPAAASAREDTRPPELRFGVLSDIHLDLSEVRANAFRKALEGFRAAGVDAVLITGDIAHKGRVDQLEQMRDVWEKVFPGGRRPDGEKVERLLLPGNHDWNRPKKRAPGGPVYIGDDFARNWERVLGEKFEPIRKVAVKGFAFILADWFAVDSVDRWFDAHKSELDPSKPLFYGQHPHPKGTCYDPKTFYWAQHDSGASAKALSRYPLSFAFSGHSHYPVTDPYSIWQGPFTSINCGSTWCSSRDYVPVDETLNGPAYDYARKPELMPRVPVCNEVAPGLLVSVYGSFVRIERRDYLSGLSLGEDWVVPLDAADRPFLPSNRSKGRIAPRFPKGASLSVDSVDGVFDIAQGAAKNPRRERIAQVRLSFPEASAAGRDRVFGYEITAFAGGKKLFSRFLLAEDYHLPPMLRRTSPAFYVDRSEIPAGAKVSFEVRAMERFGGRSSPLSAVFAG